MSSNIFNSLKRKAKNSRNAFDLSRKHVFSAKAGQLLPCLCVETIPGSHYQIKVKDLVRTFKVQTDAFARISYSYDFYFVPFSQLWHGFNEFYTQRSDKISSREQSTRFVPNFTHQQIFSQDGSTAGDIHGYNALFGRYKIADLLGYGNTSCLQLSTSGGVGQDIHDAADVVNLNPFRALAYQKIWSDFYRNPYWDTNVDPENFNVDNINSQAVGASQIDQQQVIKMFTLRYRGWKKDMFTGALPNPAYDGIALTFITFSPDEANPLEKRFFPYDNIIEGQSIEYGNFAGSSVNYTSPQNDVQQQSLYNRQNGLVVTGEGYPLSFDVLSLRKAEALQKWSETVLRQGYRTSDQFEGFFGVSPRFDSKNHPLFLGSFSGVVNIDEVVQSGGNDVQIGDIYGKGIGTSRGDTIEFDASDFGVIMAVVSFLPEAEYSSLGLDKANRMLEPFDFYNPAFDDLGFEAVVEADLNVMPLAADLSNYGQNLRSVLGYVPRFYNYKTAVDKCFGEFFVAKTTSDTEYPREYGTYSLWVAPRHDIQVDGIIDNRSISDYYVNPAVLDTIFVNAAGSRESTDQFIINAYFDIVAVQPMSVLGLPQW